MGLSNRDFIGGMRRSREWFLRHLEGMTEDQVRFKPFPNCKNVLETLAHLIAGDICALESLKTGEQVSYAEHEPTERDFLWLLTRLGDTHRDLLEHLEAMLAGEPLEREISVWGERMPAAAGLAFFTSEDYYHAGQVALLRMASDLSWDYYEAIFPD